MASKPTMTNVKCPDGVICGSSFTKEKRQEMFGVQRGGSSRNHEVYVRQQIVSGTGQPCSTTQTRINWVKNEMKDISHPMKNDDGFDYTENFDGIQLFGNNTVLINMKSVVGTGGSQTRTLRDECYKFVHAQLSYLLGTPAKNHYFANIFDGDEASQRMKHFNNLLSRSEYSEVKKYVYVGDLKGYFDWLNATVCRPGSAQ